MSANSASTLKRDLNALETGDRKAATLRIIEAIGARPATRGISVYEAPAGTGGGGIASPLTEVLAEDGLPVREYWPVTSVTSSDGLFVLEIEHIKKVSMTDANDDFVEFNYADPEAVA